MVSTKKKKVNDATGFYDLSIRTAANDIYPYEKGIHPLDKVDLIFLDK